MQKNSKYIEQPHKLHLLAKPYEIWLYILAIFPMLIMFGLMFFSTEGISLDDVKFQLFKNFAILGEKSISVAFFNSIKFSVLTTVICLILGYNVAYCLHKSKIKHKYLILLLLILLHLDDVHNHLLLYYRLLLSQ